MMAEDIIPARSEVAERWTWNHTRVFTNLQAWEAAVKSLPDEIAAFKATSAGLAESGQNLLEALDAKFELLNKVERVHLYAGMFHNVDTTDQEAARRFSQARSLSSRALAAVSYLDPMIIAIGPDTVESWVDELPALGKYTHYFDNLFRTAKHVLSPEIENILGMLSNPFSGTSATAGMLTDADFQFETAEGEAGKTATITQGNINTLLTESDRELRQSIWKHYMDEYYLHRNTLTSSLETSIKQNAFLAEVRGFPTTLDAALFQHNIPTEVFHTLLDTFHKNLPTWHRYFALRRKILGLKELRPFDLWAPLSEERPVVQYEQAVDWICEGLAPMGEDYVNAVRRGCLEDRWVDVYPNRGKRKGAFSWGVPGTPPFIVMSYGDTILSLSTLAHELGHSMHSLLAWEAQPLAYGDYSLFVAEVASNFHQALVRDHLLKTIDNEQIIIAVIEEGMANFLRYFLIMPTLARFELEVHQRVERGEGLNADLMINRMLYYAEEAFGGEVAFDKEHMGMFWATFGHLYVDYYVFQYATGISGAHAAARRILDGEDGARDDYLAFLRSGGAAYPLDALLTAGVDLTTAEPIQRAFDTMKDMIERLEALA